jgi:hypothetical protein
MGPSDGRVQRGIMCPMSDVRQELTDRGKAFGESRAAANHDREKLGETIARAAAAGIGPAEITRLIGHTLTERTVFRITSALKSQRP